MARAIEVRVFDQRAEQLLVADGKFGFDVWHNWAVVPDQQRMEVSRLRGPRLTYYPGKPISFGSEKYPQPKSLQPFCQNHYNDFDELLLDMLAQGYFITDYRRLKGLFSHYNDVMPFIEQGYVVESYRRQVILVKRDPGVIHSDIWVVDADLVRCLKNCKLLKRDYAVKHGCGRRAVYVQGAATLETLSERQRVLLDGHQTWITKSLAQAAAWKKEDEDKRARLAAEEVARKQREEINPKPHDSVPPRPWFSKIEAPAFRKPRKAQPISADTILAHDHSGIAITAKEVAAEGRKTPPKGLPANLMPDAPEDCSDEQWERLMLIEQVKFRRLHGQ